jgi:hypothetical protein
MQVSIFLFLRTALDIRESVVIYLVISFIRIGCVLNLIVNSYLFVVFIYNSKTREACYGYEIVTHLLLLFKFFSSFLALNIV